MLEVVEEKTNTFSAKTLIPFGMFLALIGAIIGGVMWLTTIFTDVRQLKNDLIEIKGKVTSSVEISNRDSERITRLEVQFSQIANSLTKIETKLDRLAP